MGNPDFKSLSDADLEAMASGNWSGMSERGLGVLAGKTVEATAGQTMTGVRRALPYLSTEKYLELGGVPEMPAKPGMTPEELGRPGKPEAPLALSGRGALSLVGDFIAGKGVGTAMEKLGGVLKRVPYMKADRIAAKTGAAPLSAVMEKYGAAPLTKEGIYREAQNVLEKASKARAGTIDEIAATGATGSADNALKDARSFVDDLRTSGSAEDRKFVPKFEKMIEEQAAITSTPSIKELLQAKTGVGRAIPKGAFGESSIPGTEAQFRKAFAGGFKKESEAFGELGKRLSGENKEIQTLLSTIPEAERAAVIESGKLPVTQVDTLLLGADPSLYLAKNLGRAWQLPGVPIYTGKALSGAGKALPYGVTGINLLGAGKDSPWEDMKF